MKVGLVYKSLGGKKQGQSNSGGLNLGGETPAGLEDSQTYLGGKSFRGTEISRVDVQELLKAGNLMEGIKLKQEELIHKLVNLQDQYDQPSEEDIRRIEETIKDVTASDAKYTQITTEYTILTVKRIVEFAKKLPEFGKLLKQDQIALLKGCSSEVKMLRLVRNYNIQTDSILFDDNHPYLRDSYNMTGMSEVMDDLLRFGRQMYDMKVDKAEYALLTAILIFSERPSLVEGSKIIEVQEIYLEALKSYIENLVKPSSTMIFAKLLAILTEIHSLGSQNSEMYCSLKLKNKQLPPYLTISGTLCHTTFPPQTKTLKNPNSEMCDSFSSNCHYWCLR